MANLNFVIYSAEVAKFFQPSIDCIIQAVMEQRKTARNEITVNDAASLVFQYKFADTSHLLRSMSSLLGALLRVTGSLRKYVRRYHNEGWELFDQKAMCKCGVPFICALSNGRQQLEIKLFPMALFCFILTIVMYYRS